MADPKPAEAITEFTPAAPSASPSKPDFLNDGKIIDVTGAVAATPITSKSVKVTDRPGAVTKSLYVASDNAGAFDVQVMLDESDAVWRTYLASQAVAANVLKTITINDLFRQIRIVYTPTGGPATVKSWVFSIP